MEKRKARRRMKKLYAAEFSGTFCFVSDSNMDKEGTMLEEADKHVLSIDKSDIVVGFVNEIRDISDIPDEWGWKTPLCAKEIYGDQEIPTCEDFSENQEKIDKITNVFDKLGWELEPAFVEDLRKVLNDLY